MTAYVVTFSAWDDIYVYAVLAEDADAAIAAAKKVCANEPYNAERGVADYTVKAKELVLSTDAVEIAYSVKGY